MKCQNCGNELAQDEVFCGQCGAQQVAPAQHTEMMQAPIPRSGLLGGNYQAGSFTPGQPAAPGQSGMRQDPRQQSQASGFYQDATENFSMVPGSPASYPQSQGSYPQQGFQSGMSGPGAYNTNSQFGGMQTQQQPFMTGNYPNPTYPPAHMSMTSGQYAQSNYGGSGVMPAPEKRVNAVMIIGIVCLIFAIVVVGIFGTVFALRNNDNQQAGAITQTTPTATIAPTATATPTPSPTPSPTPTAVPTATPDNGFSWCGDQCTQNGYQVETPYGWSLTQTDDGQGIKFSPPDGQTSGVYSAVKTPSTGVTSPNDLLTNDISAFSSQPGYMGPQQGPQSTVIGGETWNYQTIYYQKNSVLMQVTVYATYHQGKGYVIELQAQQTQYSQAQNAYFYNFLARFTFVTPVQS